MGKLIGKRRNGCELLSDFVYSFFEHNAYGEAFTSGKVVNCFQILYIRSLNTISTFNCSTPWALWIAFRFCIFVLWTQSTLLHSFAVLCCELLSDFVYSFFEHNSVLQKKVSQQVVNCFQILYIRSLNTIGAVGIILALVLWIAYRFCIFVLWTQFSWSDFLEACVVNCFQILYIRSLNTIDPCPGYNNIMLWIAFRFCIFVLWTQWSQIWIRRNSGCELLSDFVYSFFEHNEGEMLAATYNVVNCFQILYIRSLNTITGSHGNGFQTLWIAFRFCIFVLWTQFLLSK